MVMSEKSTKNELVVILLTVLGYIPKHSKITAKKIHERLLEDGINKDIRTVQRLLNILCEHYEIEQDSSSKPYGYQ
jgi:predicted transcriptional regulator